MWFPHPHWTVFSQNSRDCIPPLIWLKLIVKFKVTSRNRWIDKYAQTEPNFLEKMGEMFCLVTERIWRITQFNFGIWILASLMTYSSFYWSCHWEFRIQHDRLFYNTKKMPSKSIRGEWFPRAIWPFCGLTNCCMWTWTNGFHIVFPLQHPSKGDICLSEGKNQNILLFFLTKCQST